MRILKIILLLFFSSILFIVILLMVIGHEFAGVEFKGMSEVSESLEDSKNKNVFLSELAIIEIDTLTNGYNFPIGDAWLERPWSWKYNRDTRQPEVGVNDSTGHIQIAWQYTLDTFFTIDSYGEKWLIKNDKGRFGSMRSFSLKLNEDIRSNCYYIYESSNRQYVNDTINIVPLFRFRVKKEIF